MNWEDPTKYQNVSGYRVNEVVFGHKAGTISQMKGHRGVTYRVAVVGLGYWGPVLVRNFHKHRGFKVTMACDLRQDRLQSIKYDYPFLRVTDRFREVIESGDVDLVALAVPPHKHFSLGSAVLNAGKHLWVEKPFTTSFKDGQKLLQTARQKGLVLHVDYPYVFYGPIRKIKEMLDKGQIGRPYYYTSLRSNLGLIQEKVNIIWDLAPHDLSILFYLFPDLELKTVTAAGSSFVYRRDNPEIAQIVMRFTKGFAAYVHLSWLSPVKLRLTTIGGSKRMILFNDIEPEEKIKVYNKNVKIQKSAITPFNPLYRIGDAQMPTYDRTEALSVELEYLYKMLHGENSRNITCDIALKSLDILERIGRVIE